MEIPPILNGMTNGGLRILTDKTIGKIVMTTEPGEGNIVEVKNCGTVIPKQGNSIDLPEHFF